MEKNEEEQKKNTEPANPGIIIVLFGFFILLMSRFFDFKRFDEIFIFAGFTVLVIGIFLYIWIYLRDNRSYNVNNKKIETLNSEIENELNQIKMAIQSKESEILLPFDEKNKESITESITKKIEEYLSKDIIQSITEINQKDPSNKLRYIRKQSSETKRRLQEEVFSLTKRANLNLTIGIMTTIIAAALLIYIILSQAESTDLTILLLHYIPRISTIVFIEIFSYFFLNLYKNNLVEIKYFQNEITNIDLKIIALEAAFISENLEAIKPTIVELVKTERNFKLSKNDTTVDLERLKLDKLSENKAMELINSFLNNLNNKFTK